MATKNTNKTIFALGIVGVIIFLAVKLWPAIAKKLNLSSGGGGTGGGPGSIGGGAGGYPPQGGGPQPNPLSLGLGGGQGGPGNPNGYSSGNNQNAFTDALSQVTANVYDWLDGFEALGDQNIDQIGDQTDASIDAAEYAQEPTIPSVPTQNYDVNQNAFTPGDDGDISDYDANPSGGDGTDLGDYGFAYSGGDGDQDFSDYDDSGGGDDGD